ncbi:AAA family ATPase [Emticicia soli]|uniref:AAA family ATPase n=1 Tax=Emticicia soli TaxID=2027878 RepID=A0ABW5JCF9_9BACT
MKITSLNIKNFKSIVDITINEPNPFTVFVGPNGSGKSNIFEALELYSYYSKNDFETVESLFGGQNQFVNKNIYLDTRGIDLSELFKGKYLKGFDFGFEVQFQSLNSSLKVHQGGDNHFSSNTNKGATVGKDFIFHYRRNGSYITKNFKFSLYPFASEENPSDFKNNSEYKQFFTEFSRIFPSTKNKNRQNFIDSQKLNTDADNLEKVLKRLLENSLIKEEIFEWLSLFLPEFENIEVRKSEFSSNEDLLIYQKHYDKPFNKELISDGTYNILCLLTAVLQSDEPQFLCIEEPENGLNPFVIRKLVDFFRQSCEEKGHYIWLNTHSQTLVESLKPEELIVVDKVNGETQVKQFKGMDLHGLDMSELWLSGALGGGTPW